MDDLRIIPVTHYAVGVFQNGKAIAEHNVRDFAEALEFLHEMINFDGYEAKQVPLTSENEIIHLLAKPIHNSYDEWLEVVVLKTKVTMYSSYYGKGKEEGDFQKYALEEIGFETTYETVESLINIARWHCESYEDRKSYLPIDTFGKAIKYLTENGFRVTEI